VSNLRIGIDGTSWTNRRGFGRFTRNAIRTLVELHPEPDYTLYVDRASVPGDLPQNLSARVVDLSRPPAEAAAAASSRSVADLLRLTRAVRSDRPDVFLFPSVYTWFPTPGVRTVVGLHDTIADDLPDLALPSTRDRRLWRAKQWLALRSAARIFTVSEVSRTSIARRHGLPPERVPIVTEAPDPVFTRGAPAESPRLLRELELVEDRFVLYAGGISPHKNVAGLVDAYARVSQRLGDPPALVLVGDLETETYASAAGEVRDRIAAHGITERVRLPGFVPDRTLAALYANAAVVALPTLAEGFGLPAVEAAACGAPLVLSDLPAHRASIGDAALYVPPGDTTALELALERALGDTAFRRDLGDRARRAVAGRTWAVAANALALILHDASRR
jgi:glycosyltransferase involved in cell wall biosynthesis